MGKGTTEASGACTAFDHGTARKNVHVLEYEPCIFRENYLGLSFYPPGVSGQGRPQQIIDFSFGSNYSFPVSVFHKVRMLDLPKVSSLRHPRCYFYEEIISLFGVPNKNQISGLYHLL